MNSRPGLLDQVVRWMLLGLLLLLGVSVPSWAESILIEKSCHGTKLSLVLDSSNRMIAPMDIYRKRMLGLRDSGSGELL